MLKKLSLAALVAMGSMSFASATPLTQAIKNVDLNGMLRIRFYNESPKNKNNYTKWRTNAVFIFKVPVSENINFVFRNSTQTYLSHTESNDGQLSGEVDSTMTNNLLFMNYHQDGVNAIAGKIPVATPITSTSPATPTHGAGAIATYNVGNGFTVAGGFVTAMKNASGDNYGYTGNIINNDTYVAAGIYGNDAVKAQAWYFHVENLLKYDIIGSADVDLFKLAGIQNNYNIQFHIDAAISKYADAVSSNAKNKKFVNLNVKGTVSGAAVRVGYARSDSEDGVIDLSIKSPLALSQAGTEQYWDMANAYDTSTYYGDVCYPVMPKLKVGVAYAYTHGGSSASTVAGINFKNLSEYALKAGYQYNKKLSFAGYYDYANFSGHGSSVNNNGELRLTALYKF